MDANRQKNVHRHADFQRNSKINTFFTAACFIVVGVMWLGWNFDMISSKWLRIVVSWQMLLIVLGVANLIKRSFIAGGILVGIGVFFMLPLMKVDLDMQWLWNMWPAIFIAVGLLILFKHKSGHSFGYRGYDSKMSCTQNEYLSEDGFLVSENTFGSVQQIVLDPVFQGGILKCAFGGTVLDLRRTSLEKPETYIDVECKFGGIEIYLPANWNLQTQLDCVVGGSDDKRYAVNAVPDPDHVLIVRGKVTCGGIEFKN